MATETSSRVRHQSSRSRSSESTLAGRPARSSRGVAPWLRRLIGIREELLDWVPEERSRYTWYGAIVVNTALLAGASMTVALMTIRQHLPLGVAIAVAAVWCWVILALDSWLVSSTHGVSARSPLRVLLPRLLLSVLLALFIAEPLLFQIFNNEIRQQISVSNERDVAAYRSALVTCNPTDGTDTNARSDCGDYRLNVPGSPTVLAAQVTSTSQRAAALETQVNQINATLNAKMAVEQRECARNKWIWWNGFADVSDTCKRARADTTSFRSTSRISAYENDLAAQYQQERGLADKQRTVAATYQTAVQQSIEAKTQQHAAALAGDGMLTRAHALGAVAWSDGYAAFVVILLHALLLVVDAMPVLAKLMSGATSYDRLLAGRLEASRRLHEEELQARRDEAATEHEVQLHRINQDAAARMNRVEHGFRLEQAERALAFRAELDARTARIAAGGPRATP